MNNNFVFSHCPFCNSSKLKLIGRLIYSGDAQFSTTQVHLQKHPELAYCKDCSARISQNIISENEMIALYQQGSSGERWKREDVDFLANKEKVVSDLLKGIVKSGSVVVDVGANTGNLLDCFLRWGAKTIGIELSDDSRRVLKEKGHAEYASLEAIQSGSVDIVTAFDLIEHLHRPVDFLREVHRVLGKEGKLVILTGNPRSFAARLAGLKWWYMQYPEHIVFPTSKSLVKSELFEVETEHSTYASVRYVPPTMKYAFRTLWQTIKEKRCNGIPSPWGDHQLLVLRKK